MSVLEFIVLGLATYRVTRLITRDTILNTPRNWIWKKFPPETSKFGYLFTCEWCTSIWVASAFGISTIITSVTIAVATVFALSAVAGLLTAYEDK